MRNTVNILGVPVDNVTMEQAIKKVGVFLNENKLHTIYTPNSEIMMAAQRDSHLKSILCSADMVVPDGAGVVLASKILGVNLQEKVAGFDLVQNILKTDSDTKIRFFLFGGKPRIAEIAGKNIKENYSGVEIVGYRNGYFSQQEEKQIVAQINSSNADVLLVALGAPKQEKWIDKYKDKLNVKICIGVGGTLDVLSGQAKLAPEFFRQNGLEWLYRLYKEPWRFKRMLDLPKFILLVLLHRFKSILFKKYS